MISFRISTHTNPLSRAFRVHTTRPLYPRNLHIAPRTLQKNAFSPLAFVFDIDGVLLRGENVLPAAKRALALLEGDNLLGTKIPYILLTNGGGISEKERCRKLTEQLGFRIGPNQYIQAHTILKTLAPKYADRPVLVLGGKLDAVRRVAGDYGFKKAYTTLDVLAWNPSAWPFHQLSPAERDSAQRVDFSRTPLSAIFVFHDPRNWALDVQIMCDVIQSGGIIGGPHVRSNDSDPIELIFCNPDLLWRSDFEISRLGQGAFKEAFQAVYKALTGSLYPHVQYGKPTSATYAFAEEMLRQRILELQGVPSKLPQVYMVGDNPDSDIAGANSAGWSSVLVRTGVYDPRRGPASHTPNYEGSDVEDAVRWAIDQELKRIAGHSR